MLEERGWAGTASGPVPPVAGRFDADGLIEAVAAEGLNVDLAGAVVNNDGYENVVVETVDGWILRFPRNDDLPFAREVAILERLAGRLPVPVPVVASTGRRTRFAAYRKLTGAEFDREAYLAAAATRRDALAASLAGFLAAMHAGLTPPEVADLGIPTIDHQHNLGLAIAGLPDLPAEHRPQVESLIDEFARTWAAGRVAGPMVVLHNDFHTWNMVFDTPVGELVGIWDFSCVLVGEPTLDLRYLDKGPRDLLERTAEQYQLRTGRSVDVSAAVVANRIENVAEAIETGRPERFEAAAARWAVADAGR